MDIWVVNKRWDDLVKLITPLDLVLFAGKDVVSSTIRKLQNKKLQVGNFSHVGIIVSSFVLPHIKELEHGQWYVWESTSSLRLPGFENEVPDIFGKHKLGVQIRNLKKVLDVYNGDIYIGKLKNNPLYLNYQFNVDLNPKTSPVSSPTKSSPLPKSDTFSEQLQTIIDDIRKQPRKEPVKDVDENTVKEFDKIIETINDEIANVEKMFGEDKSIQESSLLDSLDISSNQIKDKITETLKDIDRNVDDTIQIMNEIEKELDDVCIQINHFVYEKCVETKKYKQIQKEIKYIYEIYGNRIYNASALDLLSALYPALRPLRSLKYKLLKILAKLFRNKKIEQHSLFCSQFVAIIYSRLGIIDKNIDIKNFVPVDFLGCDEDGQKNIVSNIFKIVKNS